MKLKPYEFSTKSWPPSKDMQHKDNYLFGFDVDNQPYILRWETMSGDQGWCAVTLEDSPNNHNVSAYPRYFTPKETGRRITCWAEGPLLKPIAERLQERRKTG